jgi:hypothetical protein
MNCAEFQRELPDFLEDGGTAESQSHVKTCGDCSGLVTSLQSIIHEAQFLQASEEPSPRVWNALEIRLRQEKLIHEPRASHSLLPSLRQRWGIAGWLVPAAAAVLIAAGIMVLPHSKTTNTGMSHQALVPGATSPKPAYDQSDEQLLQEVSMRAPMMRAAYETSLKDVNNYIRDAQESVNANPNDEEAQQALMDAYGQRSMIYEMALDRSLP